jgi:hypothetical protein
MIPRPEPCRVGCQGTELGRVAFGSSGGVDSDIRAKQRHVYVSIERIAPRGSRPSRSRDRVDFCFRKMINKYGSAEATSGIQYMFQMSSAARGYLSDHCRKKRKARQAPGHYF